MNPNEPSVTAAVLAGGRSRRMGSDKRRSIIGGRTMLARVVDVAALVCPDVMVVTAGRHDGAGLGLPGGVRVVPDVVPGLGPLGGVVTALIAARTEWTLVVAADMPLLRAEVLATLLDGREGRGAVVAIGPRGREPLVALYHMDCLTCAFEMLGREDASPMRLLESVECVEVPLDRLRLADPGLVSLMNVNTPSDLAEAELLLKASRAGDGLALPEHVRSAIVSDAGTCGDADRRRIRNA